MMPLSLILLKEISFALTKLISYKGLKFIGTSLMCTPPPFHNQEGNKSIFKYVRRYNSNIKCLIARYLSEKKYQTKF